MTTLENIQSAARIDFTREGRAYTFVRTEPGVWGSQNYGYPAVSTTPDNSMLLVCESVNTKDLRISSLGVANMGGRRPTFTHSERVRVAQVRALACLN